MVRNRGQPLNPLPWPPLQAVTRSSLTQLDCTRLSNGNNSHLSQPYEDQIREYVQSTFLIKYIIGNCNCAV